MQADAVEKALPESGALLTARCSLDASLDSVAVVPDQGQFGQVVTAIADLDQGDAARIAP